MVNESGLFSTSVSFDSNPSAANTFNIVSSLVVFVSTDAIGASLIGVTCIVNVLIAVANPSLTV